MTYLTYLLLSVSVSSAFCKYVGHREARFIRGTYTVTVVETSTVTSLIPSSCVQVDATLPPCRSVRFLNFPQFYQNFSNAEPNIVSTPDAKSEQVINTTPLGWGEYLGVYAPTVTVTETQIVKTVLPDPRVVVTYAVKGCRPLYLPMDLDRCPSETQAVSVNQVLPTTTVVPTPTPTLPVTTPVNTKVIDIPQGYSFPVPQVSEIQVNNNLEASNVIQEQPQTGRENMATDPLPF